MITALDIQYKLADQGDDLRVMDSFMAMLHELSEIGHDVLPTEGNRQFYWEFVFEPAILSEKHGIVLAMDGEDCIGAYFAVPERSRIQTPPRRAIIHGAWVIPICRINGIATAMMEISHARLSELGCVSAYSNLLKRNTSSAALCVKMKAEFVASVVCFNLNL